MFVPFAPTRTPTPTASLPLILAALHPSSGQAYAIGVSFYISGFSLAVQGTLNTVIIDGGYWDGVIIGSAGLFAVLLVSYAGAGACSGYGLGAQMRGVFRLEL